SFFFSSRRRHTRFSRDWSSDVCSSDLTTGIDQFFLNQGRAVAWLIEKFLIDTLCDREIHILPNQICKFTRPHGKTATFAHDVIRSEERRVGKECRRRW